MPSLSPKDRVSLCLFTFTDGRRCRTPRTARHPHFCFFHAQKETQAQAAETLGEDLAYFFSGDYLSACDLNTALSRLIPAVVRGEIKPRLARTVAYMFQTLLQSIHVSQHEYINAFGTTGWRQAVHTSVTANQDYLFPPDPGESESEPDTQPEPDAAQPPSSTPVGAGLVNSEPRRARPDRPDRTTEPPPSPQPTAAESPQPPTTRPSAATEAALNVARSLFPPRSNSTPTQPSVPTTMPAAAPPSACHPVHPEERTERSEGPHLNPAAPLTDTTHPPTAPTPPANPTPRPQRQEPNRDPYAVTYDHNNYRLLIDGKPW
ncbi:MAG TPA: hypothetical protein VJW94_04355 [Candidatus Acidoferrum sp.]|nr:hypothetical protein [Candidatus Acidoferrum sp.]